MSGRRLLVYVSATVALVTVYRWRTSDGESHATADPHLVVSAMTPDGVLGACGTPSREVSGKLVEGDGVRDLVYATPSSDVIALRFLRDEHPARWSSIGAWRLESMEDRGLGTILDDGDALRALPCLADTWIGDAATSARRATIVRSASPGISSRVAPVPPMHVPVAPTPPRIDPPATIDVVPDVAVIPELTASPDVYIAPPGIPEGDDDGGDEPAGVEYGEPPAPDPPPPPPPPQTTPHFVVVPCLFGETACDHVEATLLLRDLDTARRALDSFPRDARPGDKNWLTALDELVTRYTGRDFRVYKLPKLAADRGDVIREIFRLEVDAINVVTARLKEDIVRLQPFAHDTPAVAARKLEVARAAEAERRQVWQQAVEAARPARSMTFSSDGGRFQMNDSPAFRQLQSIAANGWRGF